MKRVLAGGCFNKVHAGHLYFLKEAKKHGDFLVVVLTHDSRNKEYGILAEERKKNLEKVGIVDKVVVGDPDDYMKVVRQERPQVIVLGWDQKLPVEKKELDKLGIKTIKIGRMDQIPKAC